MQTTPSLTSLRYSLKKCYLYNASKFKHVSHSNMNLESWLCTAAVAFGWLTTLDTASSLFPRTPFLVALLLLVGLCWCILLSCSSTHPCCCRHGDLMTSSLIPAWAVVFCTIRWWEGCSTITTACGVVRGGREADSLGERLVCHEPRQLGDIQIVNAMRHGDDDERWYEEQTAMNCLVWLLVSFVHWNMKRVIVVKASSPKYEWHLSLHLFLWSIPIYAGLRKDHNSFVPWKKAIIFLCCCLLGSAQFYFHDPPRKRLFGTKIQSTIRPKDGVQCPLIRLFRIR